MARFRKKPPIEIEAIQYRQGRQDEIVRFAGQPLESFAGAFTIPHSITSPRRLLVGDWLLKYPNGSLDVLDDTAFRAQYEAKESP